MVFLFVLFIIVIVILTLKIKIEFEKVDFILKEPTRKDAKDFLELNEDLTIKIKVLTFGYLPIFSKKFSKRKLEKLIKKFKSSKIKLNKDKNRKRVEKMIGKIKIKNFDLKANIGIDNVMVLTYLIPIFSTVISIVLSKYTLNANDQQYKIQPIYNSGNFLDVEFDGVIII